MLAFAILTTTGLHISWGRQVGKRVRILLADDFAEWRVRVRSVLQTNAGLQVIGEACNGLEAVQKASALRPDIILLDIGMPVLNGIEAAIQIREASPGTRVIFVTQNNDAEIRTAAFAIGAEQYLLKANAARELLPAIEAALLADDYPAMPGDCSA